MGIGLRYELWDVLSVVNMRATWDSDALSVYVTCYNQTRCCFWMPVLTPTKFGKETMGHFGDIRAVTPELFWRDSPYHGSSRCYIQLGPRCSDH